MANAAIGLNTAAAAMSAHCRSMWHPPMDVTVLTSAPFLSVWLVCCLAGGESERRFMCPTSRCSSFRRPMSAGWLCSAAWGCFIYCCLCALLLPLQRASRSRLCLVVLFATMWADANPRKYTTGGKGCSILPWLPLRPSLGVTRRQSCVFICQVPDGGLGISRLGGPHAPASTWVPPLRLGIWGVQFLLSGWHKSEHWAGLYHAARG